MHLRVCYLPLPLLFVWVTGSLSYAETAAVKIAEEAVACKGHLLATPPDWSEGQYLLSVEALLKNIHPADTAEGIVVASPSKQDPNYYYHWIRDAALVMDVLLSLFERTQDPFKKARYLKLFEKYVERERTNQLTRTRTGLGEPKFNPDGSAFDGEWGRPQNDGPALRALAMIRFAEILLAQGRVEWVQKYLYNAALPGGSLIKDDLEFVAYHFRDKNFDIWEEIYGHHFYTRKVQHHALEQGARLAEILGDHHASKFYTEKAKELAQLVTATHWNAQGQHLLSSLEPQNFTTGEKLDKYRRWIDSSILLGVLHTDPNGSFLPVDDEKMLSTAAVLEEAFKPLYPINAKHPDLGTAIGRYPECTFYGGNPWVLSTYAFYEYYVHLWKRLRSQAELAITDINLKFYRLALLSQPEWADRLKVGSLSSKDELFGVLMAAIKKKSDGFWERVRFHIPSSGQLNEQIHKETGAMHAAKDLSWSHAAFLRAKWLQDAPVLECAQ